MNKKTSAKNLFEKSDSVKLTFDFKSKVSKDSYIFRFLLPEQESILGFNTCQYLALEADINNPETSKSETIKRYYHPLSQHDDKGFVDFMINLYPKDNKQNKNCIFTNIGSINL